MDIPESAFLAIVTGMLSGIGIAFKTLYDRITKAADQCERDRSELWVKADELSNKVHSLEERLEDCPAPQCPNKSKSSPRRLNKPQN